MNSVLKWPSIGLLFLILFLGGIKLATYLSTKSNDWNETDKAELTQACIEDLGGYAIRFPKHSQSYCSCATEKTMEKLSKTEYQYIQTLSDKEQEDNLLPVILDCYNEYQQAIYENSSLEEL